MNKKIATIALLLSFVIGIGVFLRLENLSKQSYWMDEGYTINATLSVLEHGNTILDSGEKYNCLTYCHPTAFLTKYLGNNPSSYRLLAAIAGILTIFVAAWLSLTLFGYNTAAITTVLISLSYWQIAWSRQARWYTLFTLFFLVSILFFYKYLKDRKITNLGVCGIATLTAILTHRLAYALPFIFLVTALVTNNYNQIKNSGAKSISTRKKLYLLGVFFSILLLAEYFFKFTLTRSLINHLQLGYTLPYYLGFYLREYHVFIFLAIFGFFEIKDTLQKKMILIITSLFLVPIFFATNIANYRYLFHLTPIIYIMAAFGIGEITDNIKNKSLKYLPLLLIFIIFIVSKNGILLPQNFYALESDHNTRQNKPSTLYTPQPNFNLAYKKIQENIKDNDIIISAYPQFNKIFLQNSGYWIKYNYSGNPDSRPRIKNNREYYVGAEVINNLTELQELMKKNHGFIVFDLMSIDKRIDPEIIQHIQSNAKLIFHEQTNQYSEIWVYQF